MLNALRLAWRMQRWELGLSITALLVLTVGALVTPTTTLVGSDAWMTLLAFTLIVPMVSGLALGVGIVGRELATRTAHLAWSLSPSRVRWLVGRTWPLILLVGPACLLVGLATSRLIEHSGPSQAYQLAMTGPIVATRLALALGVGIGMGALVRRDLPGLLVGIPLMVAILAGISGATTPWLRDQAAVIPQGEASLPGVVQVLEWGMAERRTDGSYEIRDPDCGSPDECDRIYSRLTPVALAVPAGAYWPIAALEALLAALALVCFGGVAIVATARRGPD